MALNFEYENVLNTGEQPYISHEKDSTLYNYYIVDEKALDRSALATGGVYDNVLFDNEERHLTTKAVSRIGIINFPGIGGIGYYKDAYSEECGILAPIHTERDEQLAPTLITTEVIDNQLHIVINPPGGLEYTCYRVVVKQQLFAFEYITYKTECYVDVPTVKGEYDVYCIGYDENMGTVSGESNVLQLNVTVGSDTWAPTFAPMADIEHRLAQLEQSISALI